MKSVLLKILKLLIVCYLLLCGLLYFFQEKIIFFPKKLEQNYTFSFNGNFEELYIKAKDGKKLNGLLFKSDSSKGLIFYLHGNAGALDTWGEVADLYNYLHYDVFVLDYRGYGKSEGDISSQKQFFEDVQSSYNEMKKRYREDSIIVLGYSIGTGPAAQLASVNMPRMLILQAPYYSLVDMMKQNYPFVPTFLLKYKFETNKFVRYCKRPIVIFHGSNDEVIPFNSSVRLSKFAGKNCKLIELKGQSHNGMSYNQDYVNEIMKMIE